MLHSLFFSNIRRIHPHYKRFYSGVGNSEQDWYVVERIPTAQSTNQAEDGFSRYPEYSHQSLKQVLFDQGVGRITPLTHLEQEVWLAETTFPNTIHVAQTMRRYFRWWGKKDGRIAQNIALEGATTSAKVGASVIGGEEWRDKWIVLEANAITLHVLTKEVLLNFDFNLNKK